MKFMNPWKVLVLPFLLLIGSCQRNSQSPDLSGPTNNDKHVEQPQASAPPKNNEVADRSKGQIIDGVKGGENASSVVSLCAPHETVLFSCEIEGRKKIVSMCSSNDVTEEQGYLYYVYGTVQKPELTFPAEKKPPAGLFKRSQLGFGGNTGGYAYSFEKDAYKYIVYAVSGANGLEKHGVIVSRDDAKQKLVTVMACRENSVAEDSDDALLDLTLEWESDAVIESRGLPGQN